MKIFQLSDYEWYYGETLDDCYKAAFEDSGVSREESEQDFTPIEIPESAWDKPGQVDTSDLGDKDDMVSYREALELAMLTNGKAGFLCGTEA